MLRKAELNELPIAEMPAEDGGKRWVLGIDTAEVSGERKPVVIATIYESASARAYARIYLGERGHITHTLYDDSWSRCLISSIAETESRWRRCVNALHIGEAVQKRAEDLIAGEGGNAAEIIEMAQRLRSLRRERIAEDWRRWTEESNLPELPENLEEWVLDEPMRRSRYIFYRRVGGSRANRGWQGWCTHCRREVQFDFEPQHRGWDLCPCCGSEVQYTKDYVGRKYMTDYAKFLILQPCGDGGVIARGFEVMRDYSGDFRHAATRYCENYRLWLGPEGAVQLKASFDWSGQQCRWQSTTSIYEPFGGDEYSLYPIEQSGLEGTVLRHSHLQEYIDACEAARRFPKPMCYLGLYIKHPSVEHLLEEGLDGLVFEAVDRSGMMHRIVNWRERKPYRMLKSSREELETYKRQGYSSREIYLHHLIRAQGGKPTPEDISKLRGMEYTGNVIEAGRKHGFLKLLRYLERQSAGKGLTRQWQIWNDYISMSRRLGNNQPEPFPRNLAEAHDRASQRIKAAANEALRDRFAARFRSLKNLSWEREGILIRPCATPEELNREGELLKHCVASYAERHASGQTAIFFCRRTEAPDEPWYTVQFDEKAGRVVQNHGYRNDAERPIPQEVRQFVKDWERDLQRIKAENLAKAKAEKKKAENAA